MLKSIVLAGLFTASSCVAAQATNVVVCRKIAVSMAAANDGVANLAEGLTDLVGMSKGAELSLTGAELEAVRAYAVASKKAADDLKVFLKTARASEFTLKTCADN